MPQSARATFKPKAVAKALRVDRSVSMPQSARATFKQGLIEWQGVGRKFQCLNRHEQPSSRLLRSKTRVLAAVSMPQSARATFKRQPTRLAHYSSGSFQCLNRHEQPSSLCATRRVCASESFNASIGTSNLQASPIFSADRRRMRFQCLNRHEQPSSLVAFNNVYVMGCFNASIGTSNLQARGRARGIGIWAAFQCLNRHEQPSSPPPPATEIVIAEVSMPQSARATFKHLK